MASIVVTGDTSGAITIAAPAVAGTNTLTLPASTGTLVVTGGAQTVQFAAGSASTPSITFTGDTNTGIFSPGADTIAFTEGGVESMRINASGQVGIGTSSQTNTFQVAGGISATANSPAFQASAAIMDFSASTARFTATGADNSTQGTLTFNTGSANAGIFNERMRISSAGLVSTTGSILSGGYVAGAGYYRSSGMVNETVTVTTEATVYSMNKDSGGGGSSSTSTYNITGLSNTDGSSAIIYVRNSNTAGGVNTVTIVQIHGTKVWEGNVQNTTKTASFGVFRQNGAWQTTAWSVGGVLNNVW
jgi:hypothetical protein